MSLKFQFVGKEPMKFRTIETVGQPSEDARPLRRQKLRQEVLIELQPGALADTDFGYPDFFKPVETKGAPSILSSYVPLQVGATVNSEDLRPAGLTEDAPALLAAIDREEDARVLAQLEAMAVADATSATKPADTQPESEKASSESAAASSEPEPAPAAPSLFDALPKNLLATKEDVIRAAIESVRPGATDGVKLKKDLTAIVEQIRAERAA